MAWVVDLDLPAEKCPLCGGTGRRGRGLFRKRRACRGCGGTGRMPGLLPRLSVLGALDGIVDSLNARAEDCASSQSFYRRVRAFAPYLAAAAEKDAYSRAAEMVLRLANSIANGRL